MYVSLLTYFFPPEFPQECKVLGAGAQHRSLLDPVPVFWEAPQAQAVTEPLFLLLLSGWQPRWFLLCGGILSYYDSPEDAWKGCKGSIQMAVCEIQGEKPRELQVLFFCLPHQTIEALASVCHSLPPL